VRISARTPRELEAYLHTFETMRRELKIGVRTPEEVDRALRRLIHGPITLERATIAYARREGLAPETVRRLLNSWLPGPARAIAARELDTLDAALLQQWIDRLLGQGYAGSSIATTWRTLRAVVGYAATRGWVGAAPWGAWKPRIQGDKRASREAARSPEEVARLLAAAREMDDELRRTSRRSLCDFEARVASVVLLGLRQGELAGLRWSDLAPADEMVTVARQWDARRLPKGKKVHTLRALPELFELLEGVRRRLEALELLAPGGDGPVFPDPAVALELSVARHHASGKRPFPLSSKMLREAVLRAELPRPDAWTATSLRDTFATLEAAAYGSDLAGLSDRTRHASIGSLVRYLKARNRGIAAPGFQLPAASPAPPALPPKSSS
jgi:integrase